MIILSMKKPSLKDEIKERFTIAFRATGLTQAEIAKRAKVSQQSIQGILDNGLIKADLTNIVRYAEALNISPAKLLFGLEGTLFYKIPRISWGEVIKWPTWSGIDRQSKKDEESVFMETKGYEHCYILTVRDDLMFSPDPGERSYRIGDNIIVDPSLAPQNNDIVVAHEEGAEEAIIRKYITTGKAELLMAHKSIPSMEIKDGIKIYGVVRGKHNGANIEVTIDDRPANLE